MIPAKPSRRSRNLFALVCGAVLVVEAFVIFVDTRSVFSIEGVEIYDISAFASGATVSHAFLMVGDGLESVSVRLNSTAATSVRVHWSLWRGHPDKAAEMTRAFEEETSFDLRAGRQWKTVSFTRDGSSKDRWYTIQFRLVDPQPPPSPQVAIVASQNNPDRGGSLFVKGVNQPGSLYLRAERRGRTLYRRFLAEAAANLPAILQVPTVQWAAAIVFHWALFVFGYALVLEGRVGAPRQLQ